MATILEIARHADVSAESVLRVVNGEPVSAAVAQRVHDAIEALGPPPFPGSSLELLPIEDTLDRTRQQLLETFAETAAELEARLPEGVGSIVYEAERLLDRAEHTDRRIELERKERLDDVALISELITTGWRTIDRRLARVERMIEELGQSNGKGQEATRYIYVDKPAPPTG